VRVFLVFHGENSGFESWFVGGAFGLRGFLEFRAVYNFLLLDANNGDDSRVRRHHRRNDDWKSL
jgi:hypothetical protein